MLLENISDINLDILFYKIFYNDNFLRIYILDEVCKRNKIKKTRF